MLQNDVTHVERLVSEISRAVDTLIAALQQSEEFEERNNGPERAIGLSARRVAVEETPTLPLERIRSFLDSQDARKQSSVASCSLVQ